MTDSLTLFNLNNPAKIVVVVIFLSQHTVKIHRSPNMEIAVNCLTNLKL